MAFPPAAASFLEPRSGKPLGTSESLSRARSLSAEVERATLELRVSLLHARGLRAEDACDPYAVVRVCGGFLEDTQEVGRTSSKRRTSDPQWDEEVSCKLYAVPTHLEIHVYDKEKRTSDDPLGAGRVLLRPEMFSAGFAKPISRRFVCQLVKHQHGTAQGEVHVIVTSVCHPSLPIPPLPKRLWEVFPESLLAYHQLHRLADTTEIEWHPHGEVVLYLHEHFQRQLGGASVACIGRLLLTSHRLAFLHDLDFGSSVDSPDSSFWVPLGCICIARIIPSEARSNSRGGVSSGLEILLKDGREFTVIALPNAPPMRSSLMALLAEYAWCIAENTFANAQESLLAWLDRPQDQSAKFDLSAEFNRQSIQHSKHWRLSRVNEDYLLCPTYPSVVVVPTALGDDLVLRAAKWRSKQRIPVLTWLHPKTGASLCRCAQPLEGILTHEMKEDKEVLRAIHATSRAGGSTRLPTLKVIDARSKVAALANALMGGGHEGVAALGGPQSVELLFMGIDNIHCMRNALHSLSKLCRIPGKAEQQMNSIEWQHHVGLVLRSGIQVAKALEDGHPVVVHCSDGWDRTGQLVGIAQLLLDPFYRTLDGFMCLVEKDFCAFGHKFAERNGLDLEHQKEASPILLQWFDCIWQIIRQFPKEFEFNDNLLSFLATAYTSGWFRNFLCNCEKERREQRVAQNASCVWSCIDQDKDKFKNALYDPSKGPSPHDVFFLDAACEVNTLQIWPHFCSEHMLWHCTSQIGVQIGADPWSEFLQVPEGSELLAQGEQSLPAKELVEISVEIESTLMLWWKFNTLAPSNTLHFCVRTAEGKDVISRRKYHCQDPVVGNCMCVAGHYRFVWDNAHSWRQSKALVYEIHKVVACD